MTKEEQNDIYAKQHRPTEEPKPEIEQSDEELEEIFSRRMKIRNHGCKYLSAIADVMDNPSSGLDDLIKIHRAIFNLETIEDKKLRLVFNQTGIFQRTRVPNVDRLGVLDVLKLNSPMTG